MKVGVRTTPPAGTPVAKSATQALPAGLIQAPPPSVRRAPPPSATQAPPPSVRQATPSVAQTPLPVLKTPVPIVRLSSAGAGRTPVPTVVPASGATARSLVIGGLCMIAFSCGVMCTVAVDRFWPRARAQCVGAQSAGIGATLGQPIPDIEAAAEPPAPAGTTMAVTPLPPAEAPLPSSAQAVPSGPNPTVAVAPKIVPAASAAVPATRPARGATIARVQPAQGRAVVRKHASSLPVDTMSPTGMWVDPFAE